jgi:hypothetical protein
MALTLVGCGTIPVAPDEHLVAGFGQEVIVLRPSFLCPRLLAVRAQGNHWGHQWVLTDSHQASDF